MQFQDSILETLFSIAVLLENEEERAAYIKIACGDDSSKLAELQSLLRDYFAAGAIFDRPAAVAPTLAAESTSHIRRQIGPYKLRELLGEGGMGNVYVAEQENPVRRKVAIKIIKPGMGSREVIARFESERQALALMDHPNIAKVLDAGTTDIGLPYFVMELVKGLPITKYCDTQKLGTRDRLKLFLQVCQAVQHAHQKGIIHRDIKPSNVLVAIHDVAPVVKVIDFGVAKAIGQSLTDNTLYTAVSQMVGTPLYMSPEQAGQSSLDIDTRSDVYSLGVLLYELLTGTTPFDKDTLKQAGIDEMRRIIREVEPPKPSARVSTLKAEAQSTVAGQRQLEPRKLSQLFRGELDWIVMKSIEKDRNRRYESANGFAMDIQRYLDDEPVQACPPSWKYRFGKLLRRNRVAAVFVGAVFVSLSAGLSVAYWQLQRALVAESETANALKRVSEQREVAASRLSIALDAVDDMYVQVASKWIAQQSDMSPVQREFLEKAVLTYEKLAETGGDDVTSQIQCTSAIVRLARLHKSLGRNDKAMEALQDAMRSATDICEREPGSRSARLLLADTQSSVAASYLAIGRSTESIELADQAYSNLRDISLDDLGSLKDKALFVQCVQDNAIGFTTLALRKTEAKLAAERCVLEAGKLAEQFPADDELQLRLVKCYGVLGTQRLWWGEQNEECLVAYQSCLATLDKLGKQGLNNVSFVSAHSAPLANMTIVLKRLKRHSEVSKFRTKHIALMEDLCALKPDVLSYKADLAESLWGSVGEYVELGDFLAADEAKQKAKILLTTLVDKYPDQRRYIKSLVMLLAGVGSASAFSEYEASTIQALLEASERQRKYFGNNPKDFEFYMMGFNVSTKLALAHIRAGNYQDTAICLDQCTDSIAKLVAARNNPLLKYTISELSAIILTHTVIANLFEYCATAVVEDETTPTEVRIKSSEGFRKNRDSAIAFRTECLTSWGALMANNDGTLDEFSVRFSQNSDQIFPSLVDKKSFHLHASLEKSLKFVLENSIVEKNDLLAREYVSLIETSQQMPKNWPRIAMILTSAAELNVAPKTFLQFSEIAMEQDRESVPAQQALAWTLYRNAKWTECVWILEGELLRREPCNLYVLAMAQNQLGDKAQGLQTWHEAELLRESQEKSPQSAPIGFTDAWKINRVALPRLQWEAKTLLGVVVESEIGK